ncbi:MAG: hypothetical protein WC679_02625 [Bacteroidales bacterium]|jgi:hypothetical protein
MVNIKSIIVDLNGDKITLNDYLKELLLGVWNEREGFNGKRPFGNSGWEHDIYKALIENSIIDGELDDENGYVESINEDEADKIINDLIQDIFDIGMDINSMSSKIPFDTDVMVYLEDGTKLVGIMSELCRPYDIEYPDVPCPLDEYVLIPKNGIYEENCFGYFEAPNFASKPIGWKLL